MAAPLPYLLLPVKEFQLEKVSLSHMSESSHYLLTHSRPIMSVLFLRETIYSNIFRKETFFRDFFLCFLNLDSILNIFKKEMTLKA